MTGWLWPSGRDTTGLYDTPTPQRDIKLWLPKSLPAGMSSKRSLPNIGRGFNSSVLVTIRPPMMTSSTRGSGVGSLTRGALLHTAVSMVVKANSAFP